MKRALFAALWVLFAFDAAAEPVAERAVKMRNAFDNWAQAQGVETPDIAILHKGELVSASRNADSPVEMASLSKAVTAICAASLIEEGRWSAQTTSAEVLGFGHEGITVAQLMSHTAGLFPDSTQTLTPMWITSNLPRKRIVAETALNRRRVGLGEFQYNNENYGVLGEMIEAALGEAYAQACLARALSPAGVTTAHASEVMGGMLPWGGWSMSPKDYGRFHYYWFGPQGVYAKGAPASLRVDVGGGGQYGLGMFERQFPTYRNFWHFGAWCIQSSVNTGSYAVIWKGEWSVVAVYDKCVEWEAMLALDATLSEVAYAK
jgi:CubicO group peptidase (beta-lactamase class C family)